MLVHWIIWRWNTKYCRIYTRDLQKSWWNRGHCCDDMGNTTPSTPSVRAHYFTINSQQGHSGFASTTAKIRTRFWILKAMKLVKSIKSKCTFSREMTQRVETQLMVDLPWLRLLPFTALFQVSTCDYFGPLKVKIGKNKTLHSKIHMLEYQCCSSWEGCRLLPVSKFVMNDNSLCKF